MIVIADTTPLISLMKIGHLELIHELFDVIWIPNAVYEELVFNSKFPDEIRQIKECAFIRRSSVTDTQAVDLLRRSSGLDAGESEAIIMSDSMRPSLLLMDEVKGRQVARQMGIPLMGTIGMLLAAHKEKLLKKDEILECIEIMKKTGRHISDDLYEQLIQKINS